MSVKNKNEVDWKSWLDVDNVSPHFFPVYCGGEWMIHEPGSENYTVVSDEEYNDARRKKFTRYEMTNIGGGVDVFAVFEGRRNHVGLFRTVEEFERAMEILSA